ncbi:hypothetical protein FE633_13640 [Streptomyces montanus]|uniref:Uncharacterized protein n=1 Tax=Streptomyces montanus TaxID=2580423 RepID=A0A5R9G2K7_9ACTN|nr:hypothetical protein [Streptomyces montanus]TLS45795.1 hypothetical protein FE633_13640 [Streptomyces montanus]
MPQERPFFVIGQWSGPDVEVWAALEAPVDAAERSDALEECSLDAEDAFGSVEVVFAVSAAEAEAAARREAVETAKRIGRGMNSTARGAAQRSRGAEVGSHRRVLHYYR